MMLHIEYLSDFAWLQITKDILSILNKLITASYAKDQSKLKRFINCMPSTQLLDYVTSLQSILTIGILTY
jgi:hypothetical protein